MWLKILRVLKFKRRIDMGNRNQNFIGCQGSSRYSDVLLCKIQDMQDPITCSNWIQDPQDPTKSSVSEIQDFLDLTGSKISKFPRENENIRSNRLQNIGSWILEIQDPGSLWDPGTCLLSVEIFTKRDARDVIPSYPNCGAAL